MKEVKKFGWWMVITRSIIRAWVWFATHVLRMDPALLAVDRSTRRSIGKMMLAVDAEVKRILEEEGDPNAFTYPMAAIIITPDEVETLGEKEIMLRFRGTTTFGAKMLGANVPYLREALLTLEDKWSHAMGECDCGRYDTPDEPKVPYTFH